MAKAPVKKKTATQNRKPTRMVTAQETSMRADSAKRGDAIKKKSRGLRGIVPGASGSGKL